MGGRRFTKISATDAKSVSRAHGEGSIICGSCPKWNKGFCTIWGKFMTRIHLACKYGKMVMRASRQAKKWRKK